MRPEIIFVPKGEYWLLTDVYGTIWRLTRTDDPAMPLIISKEGYCDRPLD
jgi:hypothetical protein